jgi:DNA polymerase I-like protein with 3'-5' exonuclease and polymerase domains
LDRADLQVVVWEAGDLELKQMLREGVDIHEENAKTLNCTRQEAKMWVHGTNYGGSPRTMAVNCGITVNRAEQMQLRWFEAHPGIKGWHTRVQSQLQARRFVENKYGYRRFYFDRVEGLLSEALAWIPQSTVAITINKIWLKIFNEIKEAQVLLQVHDSLAGQVPTGRATEVIRHIQSAAQTVVIPYEDPLVIPFQIKTSTKSWGDCHGEKLQ